MGRQKTDDKNLSKMSPLEGGQEVKEGKASKVFNHKKIIIRLQILLAQIKVGNNS